MARRSPPSRLVWQAMSLHRQIRALIACIRPPADIPVEQYTAFRQHLMEVANGAIQQLTKDGVDRLGSPTHEYPKIGTQGTGTALDAERTRLRRQLAEDNGRAQDLIAGTITVADLRPRALAPTTTEPVSEATTGRVVEVSTDGAMYAKPRRSAPPMATGTARPSRGPRPTTSTERQRAPPRAESSEPQGRRVVGEHKQRDETQR